MLTCEFCGETFPIPQLIVWAWPDDFAFRAVCPTCNHVGDFPASVNQEIYDRALRRHDDLEMNRTIAKGLTGWMAENIKNQLSQKEGGKK